MSTQSTVVSFDQFVQDFDSMFTRRVFRLEGLDHYYAANEREPFDRFLAGKPADWAWREPWQRIVRDHRASGRIMQRVHVVTEPPGVYVEFELLRVYPASVEAGEDVRILGRETALREALLDMGDFWLFDDDRAALLDYSDSGHIGRVEMTESRALTGALSSIRDEALRLSTPLAQYVAQHHITEGKHAA